MKIDWSSEGAITWDEFCTYMQLEYAEKEDSYLREKEVAFNLPAKTENIPHRDPILRITDTADGVFIACSLEGNVTFWSPNAEIKKSRSVVVSYASCYLYIIVNHGLKPYKCNFTVVSLKKNINSLNQRNFVVTFKEEC